MARRLKAWHTPDSGDTTVVRGCLEVPTPLLPMVTGALAMLTEAWNWEPVGTMTPAEAAEAATRMLFAFEDGTCDDMNCADVITCLVDAGLLNAVSDDTLKRVVDGVPQYSFDGGTTWVDIPLSGDGAPHVPTLMPTAGADDAAKICLAATRASLVINELYGGVFGALGAGIHNALNTFSAFLRDLNSALLGLIYGEGWQILNAEILRDTDLVTNYVAPSLVQSVIDELRCLLASEATVTSTGVVIFDYAGVRDSVISATNLVDGAAIWGLLGYIAEAGLNTAGATAITDTPMDCSCVDPLLMTINEPDPVINAGASSWTLTYDAANNLYTYAGYPVNASGSWYAPAIARTDGGCFTLTYFAQSAHQPVFNSANHREDCGGAWQYGANRVGNGASIRRMRWRHQGGSASAFNTIQFRVAW